MFVNNAEKLRQLDIINSTFIHFVWYGSCTISLDWTTQQRFLYSLCRASLWEANDNDDNVRPLG